MRCKQCNAILDDNARFCRFCGAKVEIGNTPESVPAPAKSESSADSEMITMPKIETSSATRSTAATKNKNSNKSTKMLLGGVIAVILIILALFLLRAPLFGVNNKVVEMSVNDSLSDKAEDFDYYRETEMRTEEVEWETTEAEVEIEETNFDMPESNVEYDVSEEPEYEQEPEYEDDPAPDDEAEAEEDEPEEDRDTNDRLIIATGGLRLRDQPNLNGKKLALIPDGTIITIEGEYDGWAYTRYEGKYGWCSSEFLFYPSNYSLVALYSARVISQSGIELITDKYIGTRKAKTTIPYNEIVRVYQIDGKNAFVSYKEIYGWCSTEYLRR